MANSFLDVFNQQLADWFNYCFTFFHLELDDAHPERWDYFNVISSIYEIKSLIHAHDKSWWHPNFNEWKWTAPNISSIGMCAKYFGVVGVALFILIPFICFHSIFFFFSLKHIVWFTATTVSESESCWNLNEQNSSTQRSWVNWNSVCHFGVIGVTVLASSHQFTLPLISHLWLKFFRLVNRKSFAQLTRLRNTGSI